MSYYGGTITAEGRNLITSLIAGETIEFTRIVVGSGKMPDDVEPIDMKALVNPIAEATSTIPTVENNVLSMVVEYRNDMNGGLEHGFWLSEFAIFAKTEKSEEIMLYYATLGDSPQPVNAYQDNRIDIRRYPVSIALEVDADVQVTYNPGAFITAKEAQEIIDSMVTEAVNQIGTVRLKEITIPATGWNRQNDSGGAGESYRFYLDLPVEGVKESHFPSIGLHKASLETARRAGLCPSVQSFDGVLRFWAWSQPTEDMDATVALLSSGTIEPKPSVGGNVVVIPPASSDMLGGVKVQKGSGLSIDSDGNLSLDTATSEEVVALFGQE